MPSIDQIRAQFPALSSGFAYLENAGGSQVPGGVAEAIQNYMLSSYVQLGAGYEQSNVATQTVEDAHVFMREFMNAPADGKVVLGPSSTALIQLVANAYAKKWKAGDEVIVSLANHEANVGGWVRLESEGIKIVWWPVNPATFGCEPDDLRKLITDRTRLVALPHVSNLVGRIEPLAEIVKVAHERGVKVFADGVAFAPHRCVDVQAFDPDWYVFSLYKVFAPHMSAMYGKDSAFGELEGPNHVFIPEDDPYKWELGSVSHEACAGLLGLRPYLGFLAGGEYGGRSSVEEAYGVMESQERGPEKKLREWLAKRPDVEIIGPRTAAADSVPTVSFFHNRIPSDEITRRVNQSGMGIRNGHMYAIRLLESLGYEPEPGVTRVSLVHYNTEAEVDRLIGCLEGLFGPA